jgi:hypothetical protein
VLTHKVDNIDQLKDEYICRIPFHSVFEGRGMIIAADYQLINNNQEHCGEIQVAFLFDCEVNSYNYIFQQFHYHIMYDLFTCFKKKKNSCIHILIKYSCIHILIK